MSSEAEDKLRRRIQQGLVELWPGTTYVHTYVHTAGVIAAVIDALTTNELQSGWLITGSEICQVNGSYVETEEADYLIRSVSTKKEPTSQESVDVED